MELTMLENLDLFNCLWLLGRVIYECNIYPYIFLSNCYNLEYSSHNFCQILNFINIC